MVSAAAAGAAFVDRDRPLGGEPMSGRPVNVEIRFRRFFVEGDPNECWEWSGSRLASGYGRFWTGERHTTAHRFAYESDRQKTLKRSDHVHHICRNRGCVNPAHLAREPSSEHRHRHHRSIHCGRGHELTPGNTTWISTGKKRPVRRCRICAAERMREWRKARR